MKNQYFADRRDYFKYDFIIYLVQSLALGKFTFIPMLTPDNGTVYVQGRGDLPLYNFLQGCLDAGRRNIALLREFFEREQPRIEYRPYKESEDLVQISRAGYFDAVPSDDLKGALILVDPDTGFEPKGKVNTAHVRYEEITSLAGRMSHDSVLVVFQSDIQRRTRVEVLSHIWQELQTNLPAECSGIGAVTAWQTNMLVIANRNRTRDVASALTRYAGRVDSAHTSWA